MLEGTIIRGFQDLEKRLQYVKEFIHNFQQSVRLVYSGQEISRVATQNFLLKKPATEAKELQAMVDVLVKFLSTKLTLAEDEAKQLADDLMAPLFKTTFMTQEELTKETGDAIQQLQAQAEAEAKAQQEPKIVPATPDQVKQVTEETTSTPPTIVPPQV